MIPPLLYINKPWEWNMDHGGGGGDSAPVVLVVIRRGDSDPVV